LNVKKGDSVSSSAIATLISDKNIADVTLNEVDIAKIKLGQKATLTFDAISDLSLTGVVIDADTLGTVSQGVVSYSVKIEFDTQDSRVKPGMSVSVAIITDVKQDVLMVPNSAVKSDSAGNYILIPNDSTNFTANSTGVILPVAPNSKTIEVGLANDSMTEIISGVNEGDLIVSRTITTSTTSTTNSQSNSTQSLFGGSSGGSVRMPAGR
jgi:HlyD family secretion protein